MRSLEERETVLNMYFHEGKGHKAISKITEVPLETVKSWCRRYRLQNDIPQRGRASLSKEPKCVSFIMCHGAGFTISESDRNTKIQTSR